MAEVGRWGVVDALAEKWETVSSYSFTLNNPINLIDPDGMDVTDIDGGVRLTGIDAQQELLKLQEQDEKRRDNKANEKNNSITPWEVGWEWLSGSGPRHRDFKDDDAFTKILKQHEHVEQTRAIIRAAILKGGRLEDNRNYSLAGLGGIGKYIQDYSTLATGGLTGNLAVTYLGSYNLSYKVTNIQNNTATVVFKVDNSSTIQSATHPPVVGYTNWWTNNIGSYLDKTFETGPLSKTTQTITWSEQIKIR